MRRLLFFFIFMVTLVPNSYSKIVYIDINLVLNQSEIGKILNDYINSKNNENTLKYKKVEAVLLNKEKSLIAQQNILDEGEFKKKLNLLSEEIKNFRKDKKQSLENLNNIKIENTKKILSFLNPIITAPICGYLIFFSFPGKKPKPFLPTIAPSKIFVFLPIIECLIITLFPILQLSPITTFCSNIEL